MPEDQLAFDVRSDLERARIERLTLFRDHMRQDWQDPGHYIWISEWWTGEPPNMQHHRREQLREEAPPDFHGAPQGEDKWLDALRCGRCAEVIHPFDLVIGHDRGYGGCPRDRHRYRVGAFQYLDTPEETVAALCDREDRVAFPDCDRCGHPWALHVYAQSMPPAIDGRPGGGGHCTIYCGCRLYVPPSESLTPWGTCPGCWGEPHTGACRLEA